jgi:hypothetical protein
MMKMLQPAVWHQSTSQQDDVNDYGCMCSPSSWMMHVNIFFHIGTAGGFTTVPIIYLKIDPCAENGLAANPAILVVRYPCRRLD